MDWINLHLTEDSLCKQLHLVPVTEASLAGACKTGVLPWYAPSQAVRPATPGRPETRGGRCQANESGRRRLAWPDLNPTVKWSTLPSGARLIRAPSTLAP